MIVCARKCVAGADGSADSYINYMTGPEGWADELAIALWQVDIGQIMIKLRTIALLRSVFLYIQARCWQPAPAVENLKFKPRD